VNLINVIEVAEEKKPAFGAKCNMCGWCCLTEICAVGLELTDKTIGPCPLLLEGAHDSSEHYCSLAINIPELKETLAVGSGCDAKTQREVLAEMKGDRRAHEAPDKVYIQPPLGIGASPKWIEAEKLTEWESRGWYS